MEDGHVAAHGGSERQTIATKIEGATRLSHQEPARPSRSDRTALPLRQAEYDQTSAAIAIVTAIGIHQVQKSFNGVGVDHDRSFTAWVRISPSPDCPVSSRSNAAVSEACSIGQDPVNVPAPEAFRIRCS